MFGGIGRLFFLFCLLVVVLCRGFVVVCMRVLLLGRLLASVLGGFCFVGRGLLGF